MEAEPVKKKTKRLHEQAWKRRNFTIFSEHKLYYISEGPLLPVSSCILVAEPAKRIGEMKYYVHSLTISRISLQCKMTSYDEYII